MFGPARLPLLLAVGLAVSATACGGTSDAEAERRLAEDLVAQTDGTLDDAAAACVARELHDEYGDDAFRAVVDAAADRRGGSADVRVRVIDIFAGCDALGAVIDQGS